MLQFKYRLHFTTRLHYSVRYETQCLCIPFFKYFTWYYFVRGFLYSISRAVKSRPGQDGHFSQDICNCILFQRKFLNCDQISLNFFRRIQMTLSQHWFRCVPVVTRDAYSPGHINKWYLFPCVSNCGRNGIIMARGIPISSPRVWSNTILLVSVTYIAPGK